MKANLRGGITRTSFRESMIKVQFACSTHKIYIAAVTIVKRMVYSDKCRAMYRCNVGVRRMTPTTFRHV